MGNTNLLTRKEMREVTCENIGNEIRKFRTELCYNQDFMASQLGITQSAYYKIEAGNVKINLTRLAQIANILGKPLEAFTEKDKYNEQVHRDQKVYISLSELKLLQETIARQENLIEELKESLQRCDGTLRI